MALTTPGKNVLAKNWRVTRKTPSTLKTAFARGAAVAVLLIVGLVGLVPWGVLLDSKVNLAASLAAPSLTHPLGTDQLGRDFLVRLHATFREAVLPLWLVVLLSQTLGIGLAALSVLGSGATPWLRRLAGLWRQGSILLVSLPLGLVVFFLAIICEEAGRTALYAGLAVIILLKVSLQLQGRYAEDCQQAFWVSHQAAGGHVLARFFVYGVRQAWRPEMVTSTILHLQAALVVETSLSYLGFGIQEPEASLGNMLASHFDLFLLGNDQLFLLVVGFLTALACLPTALAFLARRRRTRHEPRYFPSPG